MQELIKKLPFKSFDKIKHHVKKQFPDVTDKQIRAAVKNRVKDRNIKKKYQRPFMIKIFADTTGCWFHDLFENSKYGLPRYYHIFIGTNTRYVVVNPLRDKKTSSIFESYMKFVEKYKPFKLTSDQDSSLLSDANIMYLKSKGILVQTIPDQNHSALAIIDRFIRTLRDMHYKIYRVKNITTNQMNELVDLYNNTVHSSIGMTPKEMFENPELEEKYILKMIEQKKVIERLDEGTFVRYIIPLEKMEKRRSRLSRDMYRVAGYDGNFVILSAKDGSTLTKPRFQLVVCKPAEIEQLEHAQTTGKNKAVVKRIVKKIDENRYYVTFVGEDGRDFNDMVPESYLRNRLNLTAPIKLSK